VRSSVTVLPIRTLCAFTESVFQRLNLDAAVAYALDRKEASPEAPGRILCAASPVPPLHPRGDHPHVAPDSHDGGPSGASRSAGLEPLVPGHLPWFSFGCHHLADRAFRRSRTLPARFPYGLRCAGGVRGMRPGGAA
jgi:hypothetical protein